MEMAAEPIVQPGASIMDTSKQAFGAKQHDMNVMHDGLEYFPAHFRDEIHDSAVCDLEHDEFEHLSTAQATEIRSWQTDLSFWYQRYCEIVSDNEMLRFLLVLQARRGKQRVTCEPPVQDGDLSCGLVAETSNDAVNETTLSSIAAENNMNQFMTLFDMNLGAGLNIISQTSADLPHEHTQDMEVTPDITSHGDLENAEREATSSFLKAQEISHSSSSHSYSLQSTSQDLPHPALTRTFNSNTLHVTQTLRKLVQSAMYCSIRSGCKQNGHRRSQLGVYSCTLGCGYRTSRQSDLFRHEQSVFPQQFYFCFVCGDPANPNDRHLFTREDKLQQHIKSFHPGVIKPKQCKVTGIRPVYPERCEICLHHRHKTWKQRCEHIVRHFQAGDVFPSRPNRQVINRSHFLGGEGDDDNDDDDDEFNDDEDDNESNDDESSHTGGAGPSENTDHAENNSQDGAADDSSSHNQSEEDTLDMSQWLSSDYWGTSSSVSLRPLKEAIGTESNSQLIIFKWLERVNQKGGTACIFKIELFKGLKASIRPKTRTFAVKQYKDNYRHRFEQERLAYIRFDDSGDGASGFLRCHGTFEFKDPHGNRTHNLLLEHGESDLREYWADTPSPASPAAVLDFWTSLAPVVDALSIIHHVARANSGDIGGAHCDIKPDNIVLVGNVFKLVDYGSCTAFDDRKAAVGAALARREGTFRYSPPESARSAQPSPSGQLTSAGDMWALGCILLEAITWLCRGFKGLRDLDSRLESFTIDIQRSSRTCFRDGTKLRPTAKQQIQDLRYSIPNTDIVTAKVLDLVEQSLLLDDPQTRITSKQLYCQFLELTASGSKDTRSASFPKGNLLDFNYLDPGMILHHHPIHGSVKKGSFMRKKPRYTDRPDARPTRNLRHEDVHDKSMNRDLKGHQSHHDRVSAPLYWRWSSNEGQYRPDVLQTQTNCRAATDHSTRDPETMNTSSGTTRIAYNANTAQSRLDCHMSGASRSTQAIPFLRDSTSIANSQGAYSGTSIVQFEPPDAAYKVREKLDAAYQVRQRVEERNFFMKGRVFAMLWTEPAGQRTHVDQQTTTLPSTEFYGDSIHSQIRRFIVVRSRRTFCQAIPIHTYKGKGTTKTGVRASEHSVVYQRPRQKGKIFDHCDTCQNLEIGPSNHSNTSHGAREQQAQSFFDSESTAISANRPPQFNESNCGYRCGWGCCEPRMTADEEEGLCSSPKIGEDDPYTPKHCPHHHGSDKIPSGINEESLLSHGKQCGFGQGTLTHNNVRQHLFGPKDLYLETPSIKSDDLILQIAQAMDQYLAGRQEKPYVVSVVTDHLTGAFLHKLKQLVLEFWLSPRRRPSWNRFNIDLYWVRNIADGSDNVMKCVVDEQFPFVRL